MTLSTTTNKASHVANGVQTIFPYNYRIDTATDMHVYVDNAEVLTGWTVDGVGNDSGGNVTFSVAPLDTLPVVLLRTVELDQLVDYTPYGAFPAEVTETEFDKLTMISQQQEEVLERSLSAPLSDDSGMVYDLPTPVAGHVYKVNATVTALEMSDYPLDETVALAEAAKVAAESSASSASSSASASATSASASSTSASEASASSTLASEWAENPEDVEVETGKYSALHWAAKSEADSSTAVQKTSDLSLIHI